MYNVAGEICSSAAISSPVFICPAQFAHDVLRGIPLPTNHVFIVLSDPTSGRRTLKLVGLLRREHAMLASAVRVLHAWESVRVMVSRASPAVRTS